jgi:hypothetical protein
MVDWTHQLNRVHADPRSDYYWLKSDARRDARKAAKPRGASRSLLPQSWAGPFVAWTSQLELRPALRDRLLDGGALDARLDVDDRR